MTQSASLPPMLIFGAHPDDAEFGCGGIIARETRAGRPATLVVCSRGESATSGTPAQRIAEAQKGAALLGATFELLPLDTDAHLEVHVAHAIRIAAAIRRVKPAIVLAPTPIENQHPDHARLGQLVRDACRLARYGGVEELLATPAHTISSLFFYAVTPDAEPPHTQPILVDISPPDVLGAWTNAMNAHASQSRTRNYVDLQLTRAHAYGLRAGTTHALPLYPNDPIVVESLAQLGRAARRF